MHIGPLVRKYFYSRWFTIELKTFFPTEPPSSKNHCQVFFHRSMRTLLHHIEELKATPTKLLATEILRTVALKYHGHILKFLEKPAKTRRGSI